MPWPIRPSPMKATRAITLVHVFDRAGVSAERTLRQGRSHELVEIAVEHTRCVRGLHAGAQALHHLIGLKDIRADLVAPADIGLGGLIRCGLFLALLQLDLIEA